MSVITQETFDEAVRENEVEFGMSRDEAIQDAIEQFQKSGVQNFDHLNLDINQNSEESIENPILSVIQNMKSVSDYTEHSVCQQLEFLLEELPEDRPGNISFAGSHGLVKVLVECIENNLTEPSNNQIVLSAKILTNLCTKNPSNRLIMESDITAIATLMEALKRVYECDASSAESVVELIRCLRANARCSEKNKVSIGTDSGFKLILSIFQAYKRSPSIFVQLCALIRSLLATDDFRSEAPECFQRARMLTDGKARPSLLAGCPSAVTLIVEGLATHFSDEEVCREAWGSLRALALSDDICKEMIDNEILLMCTSRMLNDTSLSAAVLRQSLGWLRNLAARDECKAQMCSAENINAIVRIMETFPDDARLYEAGCGVFGALALRNQSNSELLASCGVISLLVVALQRHSADDRVCRAACAALRNLVARSSSVRLQARADPQVEIFTRKVYDQQKPATHDLSYAALRELGVLHDSELKASRYSVISSSSCQVSHC
mmetsp:Transcript_7728/g.14032  ORF Transcript_7728/g.14032 Transcript_7728/m.14032 type:complete len:495 (-) Transcript_7728:742-2226(-)